MTTLTEVLSNMRLQEEKENEINHEQNYKRLQRVN